MTRRFSVRHVFARTPSVRLEKPNSIILLLSCFVLGLFAGHDSGHTQDRNVRPRAAARLATPDQVQKRLSEEEQAINAEYPVEGLSKRLSYHLRTRFSQYSVVPSSEATEENIRFAISELRQPSPFVCSGDFDGNGLRDTAVAVRETRTRKLVVLAFHQIRATIRPGDFRTITYQDYPVFEAGAVNSGVKLDRLVIICNQPGEFETVEKSVKLTLKNHSISSGFYLYFFVGDRYQSLLIAD